MPTPLTLPRQALLLILGGLALLMLITRFQPIEHFLELPDASWAVFFIAGFYLASMARWAFPLLIVLSVAIDWVAIQYMGVSNFCLRRYANQNWRGLVMLATSAFIATTLAYVISNGGFYWFGGRYPEPNLAQYLERFTQYYRWFLLVPCAYIGAAALVHVSLQRAFGAPISESDDMPADK